MKNVEFEKRNKQNISLMSKDKLLHRKTKDWFEHAFRYEYSYHSTWLGRPIIQFPQDIIAVQELIWKIKPDLIIETGIAHGGSLILSASILELIGKGHVVGIDIDIREHNRSEIEKHLLYKRITMIDGSSISKEIVKKINYLAKDKEKVMVLLDSKHTQDHVLKELELYSPLVTKGSYLIVFDTMIEDMSKNFFSNRPWNVGNNPKTAVLQFLKKNKRFKIDKNIENKLLITSCPGGYLKCIKNILINKITDMKFTIFGSRGFIGSNLLQKLRHSNVECHTPEIEDNISRENLGHVIYAIGLTGDFRERPFDTVEAHVCVLSNLLKNATFDSFLYLSSTRVYSENSTSEDISLRVNPNNFSDLYNISKIMGESLCMVSHNPNVKIVRLSNVIGNNFSSDDFLPSIIRSAVEKKVIELDTSLLSEKDYVDIDDVVEILPKIILKGKDQIYNVASGVNTKTKSIINQIVRITGCEVQVNENSREYSFPIISIDRLKNEFYYSPKNVLEKIETIIKTFQDTHIDNNLK